MGVENRPIRSALGWQRLRSLCIWVLVAYAAARTEAASPSTPGAATTAAQRLAAVKSGATQVQPPLCLLPGEPQWLAGTVRLPDITPRSSITMIARGNGSAQHPVYHAVAHIALFMPYEALIQ